MKSDPQLREDVRRLQARVLQLEADLIAAKAATRVVERIVEKPTRVVIDRVIEKPVTVTVEKIVEKQVKVMVSEYRDSPATVKALARAQDAIAKLQARAPEVVEKIVTVEKPVDRVVEKIVTQIVEKPVTKTVTEYRDSAKTLAALTAAQAEIARIKALPPVVREIKVPVVREITKYVDRVVMTGAGAS